MSGLFAQTLDRPLTVMHISQLCVEKKIGNLNVEDAWSVADVADHCNKLSSMQLQTTHD
jgi:hypothetical protein